MARDRREVEDAFRRIRWAEVALDLRRSWIMWTLVFALVGGFLYYSATPQHIVGSVRGLAVGASQPASQDDSAPLIVAVQLESGDTVNVPLPRGELYKRGSPIEVSVIRSEWPPRSITYRFVRYMQ